MSKTIMLTDDQYAVLAKAGATRGRTPEYVVDEWIEALREANLFRSPRVSRGRYMRGINDDNEDPNATQPTKDLLHSASRRG